MKDLPVGRVVGYGLLCAALFGVLVWLFTGSALWGSGIGLAFVACMMVALRNLWGSSAFNGLNLGQRRQVMKALRRGEPMRDPQLAPAVVQRGKAIAAQQLSPKGARIGFTLMALLGAGAAAMDIVDDGWRGWLNWPEWYRWPSGLPLMVISLVMLFVGVPSSIRMRERAERSVAETEKIPANRVARGD